MKKSFTSLFVFVILCACTGIAQTAYRSISSGDWDNFAIWERTTNLYNPTPTWVAAVSGQVPTSNNIVFVRNGHTVTTGATKSCLDLYVESGASLTPGATLRVGVASSALGGGFVDTLKVDGTLGAPGSQFALELGTSCKSLWITGGGTITMGRFRPNNNNLNYPGSASLNAAPGARVLIDKDIQFTQSGNYGLSGFNSTPVNDSLSITILPGRTVTLSDPTSYFHNDLSASATANGKIVYNINGTLDLSAHTSTTGGTKLIPLQNPASTITLNVGGTLKLGAYFKADTIATSQGGVYLNINNGGLVDATLTSNLRTGTVGATAASPNIYFVVSGNGSLRRTKPADGTRVEFNIGTSLTSYTPLTINGTGPSEVFTVTLKNTFTNPAPANTLQKEWNITEATAGGNAADTLRFQWTTADESNGFNGASLVYVRRWNGSSWDQALGSKSGSGTPADPYVVKAAGFNAFGLFVLSNSFTTPVVFVNVKAFQKQNGVQVEFANATEENIASYSIEKSADGRNFTSLVSLQPKTNNGGFNNYNYFDASALSSNNYFRIKATERNGVVKYSEVMSVRLSAGAAGLNVYPNPVRGNKINVQLSNFEKAIYTVTVYNNMGQKVFNQNINHNGGSASYSVELPAVVKKGVYNVSVGNSSDNINRKIVVE